VPRKHLAEPDERRVLLAHLTHLLPEPAARLAAALRAAVAEADATGPPAR
jgi:hypothetical protein